MTITKRAQLAWACLFESEPSLRSRMARELAHKPINYALIKEHRRVRAGIVAEVTAKPWREDPTHADSYGATAARPAEK